MDLTRKQAITGLAGILATGVAPAAFVRSMIGARGVSFGGKPEQPKPYDAEVEWIKSDGVSYIRPNLFADSRIGFDCTFVETVVSTSWAPHCYFGCTNNWKVSAEESYSFCLGKQYELSSRNSVMFSSNDNRNYGYNQSISPIYNPYLSSGISGPSRFVYNDDGSVNVYYANGTSASFASTQTHTRVLNDTMEFIILGMYRNERAEDFAKTGAICALSFTRSGVPIFDSIPVRVGQVGYLYDKQTGELYGNAASSGALVFGPDKA